MRLFEVYTGYQAVLPWNLTFSSHCFTNLKSSGLQCMKLKKVNIPTLLLFICAAICSTRSNHM